MISGWVCEAEEVEIEIDGEPQPAAYGTERVDTLEVCGDTDNGFGLLFNWNLLGAGVHDVVAYVDGVELGRATVTVTTLGAEFVRGAEGACTVADFPTLGETVLLSWQQNSQNFVLTAGAVPAGENRAGVAGVGYLENPGANSFQSGLGVLSGWVCEAEQVEIALGTLPLQGRLWDGALGHRRRVWGHGQRVWVVVQLEPVGGGGVRGGGLRGWCRAGSSHGEGDDVKGRVRAGCSRHV